MSSRAPHGWRSSPQRTWTNVVAALNDQLIVSRTKHFEILNMCERYICVAYSMPRLDIDQL